MLVSQPYKRQIFYPHSPRFENKKLQVHFIVIIQRSKDCPCCMGRGEHEWLPDGPMRVEILIGKVILLLCMGMLNYAGYMSNYSTIPYK